ncbi:MAG TPA: FAD-binding oxidoreductase [Planctomycetota bacterium]|nr:FAD-binding oxidoreductase [Planctomycetota bacterium]
MKARIAIVGGGVMGTSIAWYAARRTDPIGEPVVLLERRELAAGSSGRSGAILRQFYASRELAGMARDSLRVYAGFESRTGRSIGFQRTGVLTLSGASDPEAQAGLLRNLEMMRSIGIAAELVRAAEILALAPGIAVAPDTLGVWEPDAGFVDPQRTVEVFAALARQHGAITRIGVEVRALRIEAGRVRGVETSEGPIEADQVVVAAGPWSRALLAAHGVDLPLRAVRPEQHFLAMPAPPPGPAPEQPEAPQASEGLAAQIEARFARDEPPAAAHPVLLDLEHGYYARCEPAGARTRIGELGYAGCQETADPDLLDERVSERFALWARAALEARMPVYRGQPDAGGLAGWYTLTPDAQAILGPAPEIEGLFIVTGFSGHGFKLAPSVGEGVAQMLWGEPVGAFDAEFFSPRRFHAGEHGWQGRFGL